MRAGSRQVIDVVAIVIENAFRPANGQPSLLPPLDNGLLNALRSALKMCRCSAPMRRAAWLAKFESGVVSELLNPP